MNVTTEKNPDYPKESVQKWLVFVNGEPATFLPHVNGARKKYEITLDGVRYFLKLGMYQSREEAALISSLPDADRDYFIPIVSHGRLQGPEDAGKWYYVMQEYVNIEYGEEHVRRLAWQEIKNVAYKYGLQWDLAETFNWGFVNNNPIIYDAAPA